jgi:hypothetical protein
MTGMDITIHSTFRPRDSPDASLAFGARDDAGQGGMRWITAGAADQPGTSLSRRAVRLDTTVHTGSM